MAFQDYSNTPASNTTIGDSTFIGPNMPRDNVRPALQQLAADGRELYDNMVGRGELAAFIASGTGAVERTALAKLRDQVSATDFGVLGDDATDNTAALEVARAAAVASGATLHFPRGIYRYATSPNWAADSLHISCAPGVMFYHTGTGVAFNLDGGASGEVNRFRLTGMPRIKGTAGTTYAMDLRAVHRSYIEADLQDCTVALFRSRWAVCNEFRLRGSVLSDGAFSPQPVSGFVLDERGVGEQTSACTFYNPVVEGVSGAGIVLVSAIMNNFLGGTSEANGTGITLAASCTQNTVTNLDMEGNSVTDMACAGSRNTFIGMLSDSDISVSGDSNLFVGGIYNAITVEATADSNVFDTVAYASAAGLFTDSGTRTLKRQVRNQTTTNLDKEQFLLPNDAWLSDAAGNQRLYFAAANTNYYKANNNHIFRDNTDADLIKFDNTGINLLSGGAYKINNQQVVGSRGAALPADATDLATALTLVNAIKARLKATGGHGLVAD